MLLDTIHPLRSLASDEEGLTSGADDNRTIVSHWVCASRGVCNACFKWVTTYCRPGIGTRQNLRTAITPHRCLADADAAAGAHVSGDQPSITGDSDRVSSVVALGQLKKLDEPRIGRPHPRRVGAPVKEDYAADDLAPIRGHPARDIGAPHPIEIALQLAQRRCSILF